MTTETTLPDHVTGVAPEYASRLGAALAMYRDAETLILSYFQSPNLDVERKGDSSPVTIADRNAELLLRDRIADAFPDDGILGEEFDEVSGTSGFRWILDPIDGTKSFIYGVPLFGTLIGVEHDGVPKVGVCGFPGLSEVVYAAEGGGAWWEKPDANNRAARETRKAEVSRVDTLSESLLCMTAFTRWKVDTDVRDALTDAVRLTRGWGDCYGHALVATGRAEAIVEPAMSLWDAAALVPILKEAGGHFLTWDGVDSLDDTQFLSVSDTLKQPILDLIRTTRASRSN